MLTAEQMRLLRLRSNVLAERVDAPGTTGVHGAVAGICGVQAQVWRGAALAVRARSRRTVLADVDAARVEDRCVLRGWFMRGTLQLVATEDAGWLLAVLGPVTIAGSRRRYAQLGLDEDACARGVGALVATVGRDGPRTRAQLAEALLAAGLRIDPEGQETYHLIRRAALEGLLCHGPERDGEDTWVATADWVGELARPDVEQALRTLARRYLEAYQPATVEDFAGWSGLPLSRARQGFQLLDGLVDVRAGDVRAVALAGADLSPPAPPGALRLLGEFDPWLLGWRSRDLTVDARHARRVHPGGGMLRPALVRDGWALATWRHDARRATPVLRVEPFDGLDAGDRGGLDDDAADLGRFLGERLEVRVGD